MLWIEFAIVIAAILIGSRMKGIGLGVMGMAGLLIFIFVFHLRPTEPPVDVMLIIVAIVTTAATLQASGGLNYLVSIGERIIRKHPGQIVFLGPLVVFFLSLFAGTSHVVYSMLPVISEVSAKRKIRPERPLSISVIASHLALTGSPMSAATAAFATLLGYPRAATDIMLICIPSCLIGILAGALSVYAMGKDLDNDESTTAYVHDREPASKISIEKNIDDQQLRKSKLAVIIFGIAIVLVVIAGAFPSLIPTFSAGNETVSVKANGALSMGTIIEVITLSASALIMLVTNTKPSAVAASSLFTAMAAAVVSVFGVVWMSSTFIANNQHVIVNAMATITKEHPWTFAIAIFIMGALIFSQAATTRTMMPLGLALGIAHPALIAMFPTVNSDFVLPGYPTLLAAIQFDSTGSTRIGRFVINHSFMRPGLVSVVVAVLTGFLLTRILL